MHSDVLADAFLHRLRLSLGQKTEVWLLLHPTDLLVIEADGDNGLPSVELPKKHPSHLVGLAVDMGLKSKPRCVALLMIPESRAMVGS